MLLFCSHARTHTRAHNSTSDLVAAIWSLAALILFGTRFQELAQDRHRWAHGFYRSKARAHTHTHTHTHNTSRTRTHTHAGTHVLHKHAHMLVTNTTSTNTHARTHSQTSSTGTLTHVLHTRTPHAHTHTLRQQKYIIDKCSAKP